jgi:dihydrolipoamide dehydrogenase
VYTTPEIAGVGLTEEQAQDQGIAYKVGLFPLAANGKSIIENGERGLVKMIADEKFGEILGVHLIGPRATDLIGEMALAMTLEASVDEVIATIHPHPTVSESLQESALAVKGSAVHWPPGVAVPE